MKKYILLNALLTFIAWQSYGQADSLATVHFYSFAPEQVVKKTFEFFQNNESLISHEEGEEAMLHVTPGTYAFSVQPGGGNLSLSLQPGVTYFILCTSTGSFIQRTQSEAESDLKRVRGN